MALTTLREQDSLLSHGSAWSSASPLFFPWFLSCRCRWRRERYLSDYGSETLSSPFRPGSTGRSVPTNERANRSPWRTPRPRQLLPRVRAVTASPIHDGRMKVRTGPSRLVISARKSGIDYKGASFQRRGFNSRPENRAVLQAKRKTCSRRCRRIGPISQDPVPDNGPLGTYPISVSYESYRRS